MTARDRPSPTDFKDLVNLGIDDCLNTPQGRALLWWVLASGKVFQKTFVSGDAGQSAFNEGRRDLALKLLTRGSQRHVDFLARIMADEAQRKVMHDRRNEQQRSTAVDGDELADD